MHKLGESAQWAARAAAAQASFSSTHMIVVLLTTAEGKVSPARPDRVRRRRVSCLVWPWSRDFREPSDGMREWDRPQRATSPITTTALAYLCA